MEIHNLTGIVLWLLMMVLIGLDQLELGTGVCEPYNNLNSWRLNSKCYYEVDDGVWLTKEDHQNVVVINPIIRN